MKLLFSVTKKDFTIQTFRSGGPGGQNQNKVESGVRIIHPPSGARGESREHRDQLSNKKAAFRRLLETPEWKIWHAAETRRRLGARSAEDLANEQVDSDMDTKNLKTEYL